MPGPGFSSGFSSGFGAPILPTYQFLEDHWIGGNYISAGAIASEGDLLPSGWVPTPNVDPLNTPAVNAFYAAGPRDQGLIRQQFQPVAVSKPITYWIPFTTGPGGFSPGFSSGFQIISGPITGPHSFVLTGLGSDRSVYPPVVGMSGHPIGNIPQ